MKKMILAVCTALTLVSGVASAEGKKFSEKQLAQQQVMKDCNAEAKTKALKGADRKAFMKTCLSGDKAGAMPATPAAPAAAAEPATPATPAAPAMTDKRAAQKEKMKACNADAKTKGLKGADRKSFMSTCLSAG